jgi:NitT/TauT family transport system substrate-binding protein
MIANSPPRRGKRTLDHRVPGADARLSRRTLLRAAGAVAATAPLGFAGRRVLAAGDFSGGPICAPPATQIAQAVVQTPKALTLTWNASAICTAPLPVAIDRGIFAKHGLKVELVNFGSSTEQLLEGIATAKADAGIGMALRWLKPLEQGFDVKITAGTHGGCMRLLAAPAAGITDLAGLRGKTVGVSDMASPAKNFFSIGLAKHGVDPNKDVQWRQFPADLLGLALQKGEVQAIADGDPNIWLIRERDRLVEIATNLSDDYRNRVCCVLGVRGSLIRQDRPAATALTQALLEAAEWTAHNPDGATAVFAQYSTASQKDLSAMLQSHTHHHHPVGADLKQEIALYADELKLISVIKASTDTAKFADKVYADVLTS